MNIKAVGKNRFCARSSAIREITRALPTARRPSLISTYQVNLAIVNAKNVIKGIDYCKFNIFFQIVPTIKRLERPMVSNKIIINLDVF